eukprot:775897-Alexandrium_andersonii.AAC.1
MSSSLTELQPTSSSCKQIRQPRAAPNTCTKLLRAASSFAQFKTRFTRRHAASSSFEQVRAGFTQLEATSVSFAQLQSVSNSVKQWSISCKQVQAASTISTQLFAASSRYGLRHAASRSFNQ